MPARGSLLRRVLLSASLDVLPFWIQAVHQIHTFFVHSEYNAATQHKPRKPWKRSGPEGQDALLPKDSCCTVEAVAIVLPCFERLHSRFDGVERLCHIARADTLSVRVHVTVDSRRALSIDRSALTL